MTIIEKKQQEIDSLIKDVKKIQHDIDEILQQTKQVSEKISEIGNNFINAAPALGQLAKIITATTRFKGNAQIVGQLTSVGSEYLGKGIEKFGNWFAERKKRKLNEKMLPKKQEIANLKKNTIENMIPKIEKDLIKIDGFIQKEISLSIIEIDSEKRWQVVNKGVKELFESYFILTNSLSVCNFLIDEFNAWLNGENESQSELKTSEEVYLTCVNSLVVWSNFPSSNPSFAIPKHYNIGINLLLFDNDIMPYSSQFEEIHNFSNMILTTQNKTFLLPFSKKANEYNKFAKRVLNSEILIEIKKNRKKKFLKKLLIFVFITGLTLLIYSLLK